MDKGVVTRFLWANFHQEVNTVLRVNGWVYRIVLWPARPGEGKSQNIVVHPQIGLKNCTG